MVLNDERRNKPARRVHDVEDITEVRLLRHELQRMQEKFDDLQKQVEQDERADDDRLESLETKVAEFERKFNFGKGTFYGIIVGLGVGSIYVVDHLKDIFKHLK